MHSMQYGAPSVPDPAHDHTVLWARPVAAARPGRATCIVSWSRPPVPTGLRGPIVDGRYRLVAPLKRGGMGELYAAQQLATGRRVAIKLLRAPWCHDPVARERLRREAQASARVSHPNIVETLDFGTTPEGLCYLVMELLYGEDLQATLRRERRLPLARAVTILLQICGALAAAHAAGIVHRDLKPANCFRVGYSGGDEIKLIDFGLARHTRTADDSPLTAVGSVIGTTFYMPPEQVSGGPVDHRVDTYAAGVLLFQLVTGRPPFRGANVADTFKKILVDDPPSARADAPELSPEFDALIRTALAKSPDSRFQSMDALADAIHALPDLQPPAPAPQRPSPAPRRSAGAWLRAILHTSALL